MADTNVHPVTGADDAETIWNEIKTAESTAPSGDHSAEGSSTTPPAAEPAAASPPAAEPAQAAPAAPASEAAPADNAAPKADNQAGKPQATAPAAATADDPWKDAPPAMRDAHTAALAKLDEANLNLRRVSGTVSGLQRKINELSRAAPGQAAPGATSTGGTARPGVPAKSLTEDPAFKKAEEEFPEVVAPLRAAIVALEGQLTATRTEIGGVTAKHREDDLAEQSRQLYTAHPDYDDIGATPAFRAWYEAASPSIRAGIERNADAVVDAHEVAQIVNAFKQETGFKSKQRASTAAPAAAPAAATPAANPTPAPQPDSRRQHQLASASSPRPTAPAANARSAADPDDPEAIWNNLREEERRQGQRR